MMIVYHDNGRIPFFKECFAASGVRQVPLYRSLTLRSIELRVRHGVIPRGILYADPKCPPDDGTIIVFDATVVPGYFHWLSKRYPDKRLILWMWNPLPSSDRIELLPERVEVWSYSERDCERFGLRSNTTFYFDNVAALAKAEPHRPWPEHPRALFLGRPKSRRSRIEALGRELEAAGAQVELDFKTNKGAPGGVDPSVPYPETLDALRAADVLLDIYEDPGAGLSLRAMEALFWNRKLITDHERIERCDFFDPANIYLLGRDERSLEEFLATPPVPVEAGIRNRYLLSNWLKRFDEPAEQRTGAM